MKGDHRRPPDPIHWETPAGSCRWCGCCIYDKEGRPNFRRRWHEECAEEYKFIFWPQVTRQKLCQLRKGKCEDCGTDVARWDDYSKIFRPKYMAEHHHIIPLIDYQHDPLDPYAAWREGNLALLCHACHQERHRILRAEKRPPEPQLRLAL